MTSIEDPVHRLTAPDSPHDDTRAPSPRPPDGIRVAASALLETTIGTLTTRRRRLTVRHVQQADHPPLGRYESVLLASSSPSSARSLYEALFVRSMDGVLITSTDGRTLGANARACELLGRTELELVELGRTGVVDWRDRRWARALEARVRHGSFRGRLPLLRGDGATFWTEVTTATFRAGGEGRAYVAFRGTPVDETVDAPGQVTRLRKRVRGQATRPLPIEQDLRRALAGEELFVEYQPAFSLGAGRIDHVEALVRWAHPTRGRVGPQEFIPVAEDCGLIGQVGEQVLRRAVQQAVAWASVPGIRVWVNVSPRQLADRRFPDRLVDQLERAHLPAERLGIEVTESAVAERSDYTDALERVRSAGVAVAIDDFGTGYSSLARLAAFPVDVIKIDRSFVTDLATPRGAAVLAGIVTLAHAVGAHVIAEGVETDEQLAALVELGVDSASGFLLARPGHADRLFVDELGSSPHGVPAPRDGRSRSGVPGR